MPDTVVEMRAKIAHYFRYEMQCPMVAIESSSRLVAFNEGGQADVIAITKSRQIIEVEIKTSVADMRKDIQKPKHYWLWRDYFNEQPEDMILNSRPLWKREILRASHSGLGVDKPACHEFYFAVPQELSNKAWEVCDELYPYAGLLIVNREMGYYPYYIMKTKKPKHYNKPKATPQQLVRIAREMSATLCRLAMDLAGVERL